MTLSLVLGLKALFKVTPFAKMVMLNLQRYP